MTVVGDLMSWGAVAVTPDTTSSCIVDLLVDERLDVVFVATPDGLVIGAVGAGDLIARGGEGRDLPLPAWHPAVHAALESAVVARAIDVMRPVTAPVAPGDSVGTVAAAMLASGANIAPIVRSGMLVGSLSRQALADAAPDARRREARALP